MSHRDGQFNRQYYSKFTVDSARLSCLLVFLRTLTNTPGALSTVEIL